MLISYNHFYVTNCTNNLFVGVSVSVNSNITGPSINTSISVFTIAAGCFMGLGNTQKLTCWHPKIVGTLTI